MIEKKLDESMKRDFKEGELIGYGKPLKRGDTLSPLSGADTKYS
jgi:hypothetical protein